MIVNYLHSALVTLLAAFLATSVAASNHALRNELTPSQSLPGTWVSQGCYVDVGRTLSEGEYIDNTNMTDESCFSYCTSKSLNYAGTEYASECYCGNSLAAGAGRALASDCSMRCPGNATEFCGGPNRLNLFWNGKSPPQTNPGSGLWSFAGCYTEGQTGRLLIYQIIASPMTVDICTAACQEGGYSLAGVEYADECWCGNQLSNGGALAPEGVSGCSTLCAGNSSEFCGGTNRLDVYDFNNTVIVTAPFTATTAGTAPSSTGSPSIQQTVGVYTYFGCQTEATSARALASKASDAGNMTLESCEASCIGYTYFGTEYGRECYCGNAFSAGSVSAPNTDCNFPCAGNSSEFCGASGRLTVYLLNNTLSSTAPPSSSSTGVTDLPTGWIYSGCWVDGAQGRVLTYQQPDNQNLTVETCVATCSGLNYIVAGMEYSSECFCDNFVGNGGVLATSPADCNMPCSGNSSEICGAGNRLSVYSFGSVQTSQPATVQQRDLPGDWNYKGCLEDNIGGIRTFPYQMITSNNTATNCLSQCQAFGYNAAGLEYGSQCFCGDVENIITAGASLISESNCQVVCSGNSSTICGGDSRLSYYSWDGPALYNWSFPEGPSAGEHSLLIGGVCIPLMTSQMITGKVTFVEKFGTGEPNSTGAYELDLSAIDNFTLAWRPMHVKTDVFCSAGLILPDIAGRQLDVGGWSGESTYGVRIYWPDGSPNVWGTNDWQENVNEVRLLVARWYPTAMIMANGSILIVGGEEGSNAPASPSLELLPPTGAPVLNLDFLARTDPNNLYPFLAVIPSGIFVAYYNEARILDEVTFETIKTLPNIPGAVNDPNGGRNYPLEGAMVLLPQVYPYTDPIGVLICGGSTPGGGFAIDNCVSMQPEAKNATWLIERMPSRRVMPCLASLPDGTTLILNGAHHGFAGFGLGSDPNFNAVLYDPRLPINSRMSVMANTSVARLYHSEAILLLDGRVMVSGSDPQDNVHPEEYRVEVFTPPYLLSGLPRPTFYMNNTDWSYSQIVPFAITSNFTSTANVNFSILGSVVSTHGNSMGQRTLFPQLACGFNNTCTITAPPNAHICPPGWYMVFVLDGPTPSVGAWVRIGGDPAHLGNWPNAPGFDIPGL
ncbi:uncharacterized protein EAE98_003237 [Botrytis deweyae]|uniref:WSC domain-containing protein n=1 Tax=Botrytis deweyae TaxID=2478750 RepID=A0ABQ7ISZ4_9HELO|nr:uncharacterized protein EAE98_003237 [Botrytis deweyae]KAF7933528.1 hypothetical protein EAE98_003237 [Botrytis deweyae]